MMYQQNRNDSFMARKPMVYDRERNGSARSLKSARRTNEEINNEENIHSDRSEETRIFAPKPPPKNESPKYVKQNSVRPNFRAGPRSRATLAGSDRQQEGRGVLSQPRYFLRNDKSRRMSDDDLHNLVEEKEDPYGKSIMTRRRMSRNEMTYFPDIQPQKGNSVRTSRSEPTWMDYTRPRRMFHDRHYMAPGSYMGMNRYMSGNYIRKYPTDKSISFYRNFESSHPEIRMVLNDHRFRDLLELIDELAKILHLSDREKYIHSSYGTIIRDLSEFEDGGVYFFGPPYIYEFGQYHKFREQLTPDLIESDTGTFSEQNKYSPENEQDEENDDQELTHQNKCKEIKIVSNLDGILRPIRFLIESRRHKSLFQVLYDLSELFSPRYGRVEGLCTRKGRTILNVRELFESDNEEEYVAICTPMFEEGPYYGRQRYVGMINDPFYPRHGGRSARMFPKYEPQFDPARTFEVEVNGKNHQFEASTFQENDVFNKRSNLPPEEQLHLNWVYGYNGKNCRNNLFILPSEEIVYFVAKVIVIYDDFNKTQRFYTSHTDEIRCMMQHPNSWIFASAQVSGSGEGATTFDHVHVWDSKSMKTLQVLSFEEMELSIECLAFSQADNGVKLATISTTGDEWCLSIWDWQKCNVISKGEPYKQIDLACAFDPSNNDRVVSCGKQHVYFWDVSNEMATCESGEFEGYEAPEYVTCLAFNSKNELITGDSNAFIHFWSKYEPKTESLIKTKHTGSIIIIQLLSGEHLITGGGSDRMLTLINCSEIVPTITEAYMSEDYGGIVAIAPVRPGFVGTDFSLMKLFLGTSMNNILSGTMESGFESLVNATSDSMTALSVHPQDNTFVIAGGDSHVKCISGNDHGNIWETKLEAPCTASVLHSNGKYILVGMETGEWLVLDAVDSKHIDSHKAGPACITCFSFSPDSNLLAVGNERGSITIYGVSDAGKRYYHRSTNKICRNAITSIDWNTNGSIVRIITSQYDVRYLNVFSQKEEVRKHVIRDLLYESQTCALHHTTAGIWNTPEKEILFSAASVSSNEKLLCTGTNMGGVRLYRYPVNIKMPLYNEVNINSGPISKVLFMDNDNLVVTCGEVDYCIAQWIIGKKEMKQSQKNIRRSFSYNSEENSPRKENNKVVKQSVGNEDEVITQDNDDVINS